MTTGDHQDTTVLVLEPHVYYIGWGNQERTYSIQVLLKTDVYLPVDPSNV